MSQPKYVQAAALIRGQINDGVLPPGAPAPSGAALARATGYSVLTCRKALRTLVREGVLVPGSSASARPRVPGALSSAEQGTARAGRALSAALAARRRAAGMTQPQLAELIGLSVTTLGHAETGRLWQSRCFWEYADKAVSANGELLALHDAYRAAAAPADPTAEAEGTTADAIGEDLSPLKVAAAVPVTCVTITWADGAVTTVYPPRTSEEPAGVTPV
jgi:hypothetical protein